MMLRLSLAFALALGLTLTANTDAFAQPKDKDKPAADGDAKPAKADGKVTIGKAGKTGKKVRKKEKLFDFTALKLDGSTRMPQLLYFLERASEELERASLKKRSFVPEMVRSLDEDAL